MRKKIEHSVTLVRRAERLALEYDAEDGFYNTFSGGKDSQALYYIVKMAKVKFKTHMSLTSVDPADVIRFVKREYPSVVRHKPKMSMFADAVEKQILPTMRVRWCCADFKESAGAGKVTLIGIRAQESNRRAKRNEVEVSNRTFSGNLSQFFSWSESEKEKKLKKLKRKLNEDEFSVSSDNEVHCINGKDSILISPIFHWTEQDVWYFLNEIIHAPHCSLYDEGYTRIGCILCPMATPKSKRRDVERFPHVKRGWIKAIKAIRRGGVFVEGYIWWNLPATISRVIMGQPTLNTSSREGLCKFFSDSPAAGGVATGQWTEDEIAEAIFDWWISGKPYKKWYADKYLQQKFDF